MPLYNFECQKCKAVVEKMQKGEDQPDIECPECGDVEFKKLMSAWKNRKKLDSKELYSQKIAPDAKRIMKEMSGSDKHFMDIYGNN